MIWYMNILQNDYHNTVSWYPKNEPWVFIGRTDADAKALELWPSDSMSRLTGKDIDAGKDWGQEKWIIEDGMVE